MLPPLFRVYKFIPTFWKRTSCLPSVLTPVRRIPRFWLRKTNGMKKIIYEISTYPFTPVGMIGIQPALLPPDWSWDVNPETLKMAVPAVVWACAWRRWAWDGSPVFLRRGGDRRASRVWWPLPFEASSGEGRRWTCCRGAQRGRRQPQSLRGQGKQRTHFSMFFCMVVAE